LEAGDRHFQAGGEMSTKAARIDERAVRTRNNIARAVVRLGTQRGVDRLTVGELAQEAGVSRSTFYAHFGSLGDYLAQSFGNMVAGHAAKAAHEAGPGDRRLLHIGLILDHVAAAPGFVAALSRSRYRPQMLLNGEEKLSRLVESHLRSIHPEMGQLQRVALARFVAAGFIGMLRDWMASGMRQSKGEFERQFGAIIERLQ
jgi:AcrR family transcriptional regulator